MIHKRNALFLIAGLLLVAGLLVFAMLERSPQGTPQAEMQTRASALQRPSNPALTAPLEATTTREAQEVLRAQAVAGQLELLVLDPALVPVPEASIVLFRGESVLAQAPRRPKSRSARR